MKLHFIKRTALIIMLGIFLFLLNGCSKNEFIGVRKVDLVLGYYDGYYPKTSLVISSSKKLDNVELLIDNVTFNYKVYYNLEYIDKVYLSIIEITFYKTNVISSIKLLYNNKEYKFNIGHIEFQKLDNNYNKITSTVLRKMVRLNTLKEILELNIKNNEQRNLIITDVLIPSNVIHPYITFTIMPNLTATRMLEPKEEIYYGDIYVNKANNVLNVETIISIIYIYEGKEYTHYQAVKSSIDKDNISFIDAYDGKYFEVIKC